MMESIKGYVMAEFCMQTAVSPSGASERVGRLLHAKDDSTDAYSRFKREFETIWMIENENPLLFLGGVGQGSR